MLNLGEKLKKAASYFVVMDEPAPEAKPTPGPTGETPAWDFTPSAVPGDEPAPPGEGPTLAVAEAPAGARTVEDIVRASEGPNLDEITVSFGDEPPPRREDGGIDFPAVYAAAGLPEQTFTAEQALEMIASLPPNLPADVKRQTAQISINALGKATGTTIETIVADASRKIAAIHAYAEDTDGRTGKIVSDAESEIATLTAMIEEKRGVILEAQRIREQVQKACVAEVDHLDDILAFFSTGLPAEAAPPPPTDQMPV
jgi:hypothetical protein